MIPFEKNNCLTSKDSTLQRCTYHSLKKFSDKGKITNLSSYHRVIAEKNLIVWASIFYDTLANDVKSFS